MEKIIALLKSATPPVLIGLSLGSGLILFLPTKYLEFLGITKFTADHRHSIGLIFIFSTATTLGYLIIYLLKNWRTCIAPIYTRLSISKKLNSLTANEKAYLLAYIRDDEPTQYFSIEDGVAGGLNISGVIFRSTEVGNIDDGFAFNLHPYAKKLLTKKPRLLDGAQGKIGSARERRMSI